MSTEYIRCGLCLGEHILDKYNWVDSCQGYISLGDFEMIVKYNTGKNVEYAEM